MYNYIMKEIFYSIKTRGTSSKDICLSINTIPSTQYKTICFDYEGGGIWVKTLEDPIALKHKLERIFEIELGDPQYES